MDLSFFKELPRSVYKDSSVGIHLLDSLDHLYFQQDNSISL